MEHDTKHTRDARDELPFQLTASFFSNLSQRKAGVETGRSIPECLERDDEEPIYQYGNLKSLQVLVENELQTDLDRPIMFLGHSLCNLGKPGKLQELRLNGPQGRLHRV